MLMTGESLYVVKNDYTPAKINAREGHSFIRDSMLLEQPLNLSWTSKKGFSMGVVLFGEEGQMKLKESFDTPGNTFIAALDFKGIRHSIEQAGSIVSLRELLTKPNPFSSWLCWPQYPNHTVSTSNHDLHALNAAYEQWFQFQGSESSSGFNASPQCCELAVKAVYRGSQRFKSTSELVYRFDVTSQGMCTQYHLIAYESDYYLLDYVYDSVPFDIPLRLEILEACRLKLPRDNMNKGK